MASDESAVGDPQLSDDEHSALSGEDDNLLEAQQAPSPPPLSPFSPPVATTPAITVADYLALQAPRLSSHQSLRLTWIEPVSCTRVFDIDAIEATLPPAIAPLKIGSCAADVFSTPKR